MARICAGRTDGFGGFTCVTCGDHHERQTTRTTNFEAIIQEAFEQRYGDFNFERYLNKSIAFDIYTCGFKAGLAHQSARVDREGLEKAAKECADDLEAELRARYAIDAAGSIHPAEQHRFDRDMEPVLAVRAALTE